MAASNEGMHPKFQESRYIQILKINMLILQPGNHQVSKHLKISCQ